MVDISNTVGTAGQNIMKQGENAAAKTGDNSFGTFLKSSLENAIETQHAGEKVSAGAVVGNADMIDVLQAVTEAETTLNTVLAVRDRLINAYQEIMRTPI